MQGAAIPFSYPATGSAAGLAAADGGERD